jgi:hypothetical protein
MKIVFPINTVERYFRGILGYELKVLDMRLEILLKL